MRQRNYIYSEKEVAQRVAELTAQGKKIYNESRPYWWDYNGYQEFAKQMAVEGYCEVVECWDIDESCADDERNPHAVVRHHGHVLHVLGTEDYYFIMPAYRSKGKYRLYDERERQLPTKYFKTELPEPNDIGVPSRKKIEAWVRYWEEYMKQAKAYVAKNSDTLAAQERALLINYPDAQVYRSEDGVIREIHFREGVLDFKYERSETGFCRSYTTNYWAVPSFESQTTIKEKKDPVEDGINKCLDVLDDLCAENPKDTLSDVPHYKLEEAITDIVDILGQMLKDYQSNK